MQINIISTFRITRRHIFSYLLFKCSISIEKYAMHLNLYEIFLISSISNANNSLRLTSGRPNSYACMKKKKNFTFPSILSSRPTGSKNFRSTWIGQTCPNKKAKVKTAPLCQKQYISKEHYSKRKRYTFKYNLNGGKHMETQCNRKKAWHQ